ncbi:hypothetical protein DCAR_0314407 [Daucus carota subsp. sativus]|uniref:Myb-like domain-containing protein n=1 Tax=Daucus carota subsp. sativus TaxID=79200 RepID=A0AAF0WS99_DAUCS|nr:PREDICTED: uncharacterized protein LOC108214571 [Daucus carota subsp. sativus]XP_017242130.1 PREDICTED: uncharacterized protein LOC108214571 [Daucus carota subsp. sativus]WOG95105.1 hypothetical protein DCAR_0314407 [Daucus carota subsp. sativus]
MAASADPCGDGSHNNNNGGNQGGGGAGGSNGNGNNSGIPVASGGYYNYVFGPTVAALKHDPGLSLNWSPEEIALIHQLSNRYDSESTITKYAKIAQQLNDKTIRDVILYHKKMNESKKENKKRRRDNDTSSRKDKDKKEEVVDPSAKSSSYLTNRSNGQPYAQTAVSMDSDDGISYKAIGGVTGRLLEQNAQAMDQISANFRSFKIHDNINLFCQARNNIISIIKDLNDVPEVMKQMPPLPVKLNEELSSKLLPPPSLHK